MKRKICSLLTITLCCIQSSARELRTPLKQFPDTAHRLNLFDHETRSWGAGLWCEGYYKTADKAFTCNHGTTTEPLAALLFGKADFLGKEIFADAANYTSPNVWLNISTLSVRFRRTEKGSVFGALFCKRFKEDKLKVGLRASLPIKIVDVDRITGCDDAESSGSGELGGEQLSDVVKYQAEIVDDLNLFAHGIINFAYRLDFLSLLEIENVGPSTLPFVEYKNADFADHITIAYQDVTHKITTPIFVARKSDSSEPDQYHQLETDDPGTNIDGNGENLADGAYGRFIEANDYTTLGNNSALQKQFWIIPGIRSFANSVEYTPEAKVIRQMVDDIVRDDQNSAEDFFNEQGVCFNSQRRVGIGDLKVECFANYLTTKTTHIEGIFGLTFPTAEKMCDPKTLLGRPLGNNGHVEAKFGLCGGWKPRRWFQATTDLSYSFVFKRKEKVPAAFKGATVKNIGPTVEADISWGYFFGDIALHFFNPDAKHPLGVTGSYELYARRKNKVCFCNSSTKDFFGETNTLDGDVLADRTNVIAHKVLANFFYQTNTVELFMGFSHIFAGKNAPKETEWHIGLLVSF